MSESEPWARFRDQMPVTNHWSYLDHAAVAPLPKPSRDQLRDWCDDFAENGDANWLDWFRQLQSVRANIARMISASESEIAFIPNTTAGINIVADGYPWKSGDNVVTFAGEFPSNSLPWLQQQDRGVEVRRVESPDGRVDLNRISDACDDRTRLVAISWVGYASGWRIDVDAVCDLAHRRGALVMLDAIQGLGVFPLNVRNTPVDFLAADGHKWMLGPEGAGVFYARAEHLNLLRPIGVGWNSAKSPFDFGKETFELKETADRYEGGTLNSGGFLALGRSIDLLQQFGAGSDVSAVGERVIAIADYAVEKLLAADCHILSPRDAKHKSGIVTFAVVDENPETIRSQCRAAGVIVSSRGGGVRISPHAYNNEADIDRLVDVICT
ncbi:MAG: aminotransferase class V-fold PLP-dependent enzyme [Planctomycetales bacterium]|nr:aminotransferase class V-fold PLP-dependent enzyme [Planctomycetales bacterium]